MSQMGNTKLGFMNVPNGDAIAFDMKESEINPSVVYHTHICSYQEPNDRLYHKIQLTKR